MNDKILKNQRAWRRLLLLSALPVLLFSSCNEEQELSPQEITLTTPVIELGGVEASASRTAASWDEMVDFAGLYLNMHNEKSEAVQHGYFYYNSNGWHAYDSYIVTLTGGPGTYRAGMSANVHLNADASTGMPAIRSAWYGYRGTIEVQADGSFAPGDVLHPLSSAVQWKLKDADGNDIDPSASYLIRPVGLAYMYAFTVGNDGQSFPDGTAEPVPNAYYYAGITYSEPVYGSYTPGTYPATWPKGKLEPSAAPSAPWPLVEVVYCKDGFEYDNSLGDYVPDGPSTTWTVSYPAKQLKLEAGKLYTFTIGLSKDAHITLGADDISIAPWQTGTPIHVGR